MFVFKAAVVGAGTMGGQIAQAIAAAGIPVVLKDVRQELVDAGIAEARKVTESRVKDPADVEPILARITGALDFAGFGDVDFVVEAIPERLELKQDVFAELDACTPGHAILASNTSSLSITEIGDVTLRPDKVVGFHFFYPASVMPLVEIVEGDETSPETVQAAVTFAQAIRKQPITCAEVPGFVVNRILNSGISEIWRAQEEGGLSIAAIDEGLAGAGVVPIGPYRLVDLLGLDTVLHVAEHLEQSYGGERFHVPETMVRRVEAGKLGAKSGGEGFYDAEGNAQVEGDAQPDVDELAERLALKTFIEACLVLEEGVATHRDIDFGMMAGAGLDPRRGLLPPFMRADADGLDVVLERLERAAERLGESFEPPVILRRLVAQGRLGAAHGQGFYAYARPDADQPAGEDAVAKLETRGPVAILWLANGQVNQLSPTLVDHITAVWRAIEEAGSIRAVVIASANPMVFCAGADLKAFAAMADDPAAGPRLLRGAHDLLRELNHSSIATVVAVNGVAFGGGCELAMAGDVRIAARSALFGQPEIKLGIIPGLGGTQRLPRLVGTNKALEMNLIGDPVLAQEAYEVGLVNRVVDDHELLDTALAWARKLSELAPLAVRGIKVAADDATLDAGIDAELDQFGSVFASADAREGIAAFLGKRRATWKGA